MMADVVAEDGIVASGVTGVRVLPVSRQCFLARGDKTAKEKEKRPATNATLTVRDGRSIGGESGRDY